MGMLFMLSHLMLAFNVVHDANHNALFKSKKLNTIFGYIIELLGSNRKLWIHAHNIQHHSFINIHGHDDNIAGYGLLRLCPQDKWLPHHKYQWLYAPFVYALSTLNYATLRDVKLLFSEKQKFSFNFYAELILFKLFYYSYVFLIPVFVFGVSFKLILSFYLLGHLVNGLFLAIIFVIGHLTEGTHFPELDGDIVHDNWTTHVIKTTCDYATDSKFLQWVVGGVNLHVAHHLFPKICHVHYKAITPLIQEVVLKHGYAYKEIPSFTDAFKSHFAILKQLGQNPDTLDSSVEDALG